VGHRLRLQQWHYVLTDQKIKLAADTDFVVTLQDGNIVLAKSLKKDEEGYDFQRWDFKDWTLTSKGDHKYRMKFGKFDKFVIQDLLVFATPEQLKEAGV